MINKIKRLKELASKDIYTWTKEENEEYKILAKETGVSIGLDNKLYKR